MRDQNEELKQLSERLEEAESAAVQTEILERRVATLRQQQTDTEKLIIGLDYDCRKEHEDVEQLSRLGWTSLWFRLTGGMEEQRELEQQQADEALLRLKQAQQQLEAIKSSRTEAGLQLAESVRTSSRLELLRREKEELLTQLQPEVKAELHGIDAEMSAVRSQLVELGEASSACASLCSALERAMSSLDSASDWGTYDMFGGGMISTSIKHSRIDAAQEALGDARHAARRLESELKDLHMESRYEIPISESSRIGDYLLDGFLMDWHVQKKIEGSRESTRELLTESKTLHRRLETEKARQQAKVEELRRKRERLILKA